MLVTLGKQQMVLFCFFNRHSFISLALGKWSELKSASDANATIMSAKKRPTFDVGARVFAKVRGYPAWPARVETVFGTGSKYSVFFYGTYESATVKPNELWPYDEASKAKHGEGKRPKDNIERMFIKCWGFFRQAEAQGLREGPGRDRE